jgi:hypothetical protein
MAAKASYYIFVITLFLFSGIYAIDAIKTDANQQATLESEYGDTVIVENVTPLDNKAEDKRLLITTSSKDKVLDKGYWVVITKDGKTIKVSEKIKDDELVETVKNTLKGSK